MPPTKKPQPFKFTDLDGKEHPLPFASEVHDKLPGQVLRDALLNGEMSVYLFKLIEAADVKPAILEKLYALPQTQTLTVLDDWVEYGDGDGASLGESSSSST